MIDATILFPALGRSVEEAEVQRLFSNAGISLPSELSLPEDEYRAYIERPGQGVSFVFTDEAFFLGQGDRPIGEGALTSRFNLDSIGVASINAPALRNDFREIFSL